MKFEWDEIKNDRNIRKHGISFREGVTVFFDENALLIHDQEHSDEEEEAIVKKEYDFSNAVKNPYAKKLKKQITININSDVIEYFREESERTGIPYQTLINLYLADCAQNKRKLNLIWE